MNEFKPIQNFMFMKNLFYATIICLVAISMTSCGGNQQQGQNQDVAETAELRQAATNVNIVGYTWNLVQLHGEEVPASENPEHQPRFTLNTDNTVVGHGGCNTFRGTFYLEDENHIQFSPMAATMMFCMDKMEVETEFLRVLEIADNYVVSSCCGKLSLNEGETRLARFERVE